MPQLVEQEDNMSRQRRLFIDQLELEVYGHRAAYARLLTDVTPGH